MKKSLVTYMIKNGKKYEWDRVNGKWIPIKNSNVKTIKKDC